MSYHATFEALVAKLQWDARVNDKLLEHLLEPVPRVSLPACLTVDMLRYLYKIANLCRKKTGACSYDYMLREVRNGSEVVTSPNDPDRDGRVLWYMLGDLLPPCKMTEEHVRAFDEFMSAVRKAEKERKFRDEVLEWALERARNVKI